MASRDHTLSPFVYGGDNPVNLNDPSGLSVDYSTSMANPDYVWQLQVDAAGRELGNYNSQAMARSWGWDVGAPRGGGAYAAGGTMYSDAADVRWGRMSIEEYAQKYGGVTIKRSDGGTFSVSIEYGSAEQENETGGQGIGSQESNQGNVTSQGGPDNADDINAKFGVDFDMKYLVPLLGIDKAQSINGIRKEILNLLERRMVLNNVLDENGYQLRAIMYYMSEEEVAGILTQYGPTEIIPSSEWTLDPMWPNPSTLRSYLAPPFYKFEPIRMTYTDPTTSTVTTFNLVVTFQRVPNLP